MPFEVSRDCGCLVLQISVWINPKLKRVSRRLQSTPKRWDINHSQQPPWLAGSHQESFFLLRAPRQAIDFPCPDQYLAVTLHDPYQHYKNQCRCSDVYLFVHSAGAELSYVPALLIQFWILNWPFKGFSLYLTFPFNALKLINYLLDWLIVFFINLREIKQLPI